jgi:hypothetical protein
MQNHLLFIIIDNALSNVAIRRVGKSLDELKMMQKAEEFTFRVYAIENEATQNQKLYTVLNLKV